MCAQSSIVAAREGEYRRNVVSHAVEVGVEGACLLDAESMAAQHGAQHCIQSASVLRQRLDSHARLNGRDERRRGGQRVVGCVHGCFATVASGPQVEQHEVARLYLRARLPLGRLAREMARRQHRVHDGDDRPQLEACDHGVAGDQDRLGEDERRSKRASADDEHVEVVLAPCQVEEQPRHFPTWRAA